jgi:hypothetical protein
MRPEKVLASRHRNAARRAVRSGKRRIMRWGQMGRGNSRRLETYLVALDEARRTTDAFIDRTMECTVIS